MKRLLNSLFIGLTALLALVAFLSAVSDQPFLAYVYSGSMKPLMQINDAFFIQPANTYAAGDIITYRPLNLQAELVTHRILANGSQGFVTKGDNNSYTDQSIGEPEVTADRIIGKAFMIFNRPIILPRLGLIANFAEQNLGRSATLLSGILIALGFLNLAWGFLNPTHRKNRKSRRRLRLRDLYRIVALAAVGLVLVTLLVGSKTTQIRFLVTEKPGTRADQLPLGEPGELEITIENQGLLPVWSFIQGEGDWLIAREPLWIGPLSKATLRIQVPPQQKPGWQQVYIQSHAYPVLSPRWIMENLDRISPLLAMLATGLLVYLYLSLILFLIQRVPGLEGWVPLKSFQDKPAIRRIRRIQRWLMSGKRART